MKPTNKCASEINWMFWIHAELPITSLGSNFPFEIFFIKFKMLKLHTVCTQSDSGYFYSKIQFRQKWRKLWTSMQQPFPWLFLRSEKERKTDCATAPKIAEYYDVRLKTTTCGLLLLMRFSQKRSSSELLKINSPVVLTWVSLCDVTRFFKHCCLDLTSASSVLSHTG